ncbi:4-(cytidine 5'-diphospho)-2-C-methyl-D-erythritol kinase [candidate division KSB1 bacterium]|nr:4-(cytidine 5'-diphospho)-2-C-methyl-D-erythritol kinase [candidate division KSB1 bacterium]
MITVPSCAKINLHLRLLRKRKDGFHDLETIFQEIDLCDQLHFDVRPGSISVNGDAQTLPSEEDNLVYKAAVLLSRKKRKLPGCRIHLDKKIPIGAGLGGGSSNAAATLKQLNNLWNLNLSQKDLSHMALQLGSDVPFFLLGGTAIAYGRGEELTRLSCRPDYTGVLVYPNFGVSTAWAYENNTFDLTKSTKNTKFIDYKDINDPALWPTIFCNDLEPAVYKRFPVLSTIHGALLKEGAFYSRMSGSGSSIFGLFFDPMVAKSAREHLCKDFTTFIFRPVYKAGAG